MNELVHPFDYESHSLLDDSQLNDAFSREFSTPSEPLFPQELTFLLAEGLSSTHLNLCVKTAKAWNVEPLEALLALDMMDETTLYRILARRLRCRFIARSAEATCTPPSNALGMHTSALLTGVLPIRVSDERVRYALAPQGKHLSHLARLIRDTPAYERTSPIEGAAITTPRILRELARQSAPALIADQSANELPNHNTSLSIRDGLNGSQKRALSVVFVIHIGMVLCAPWVFITEHLIVEMACISLLFLTLITLRLSAACENVPTSLPPERATRIDDGDLPLYTLIIPLYREVRVIPQLLNALRQLDYPSAKLDVKIVIEEKDTLTREALSAIDLPSWIDVVCAPDGQPRTKPRALNMALKEARGTYTVIYDAEDVPDPLQLRHSVATFASQPPHVACLQARLVIDNTHDSWLTTFFTIEYSQLFDVLNPALTRYQLPVPLGGTSNHFRTDVLREVMGWDAWNVTEDADLGFRLALNGYGVGDLPSSTFEEAPAHLKAWLHQRSRWLKGWMQVCITHSRHPIKAYQALGCVPFLTMIALSFGTVLTAMVYPFGLALAVYSVIQFPLMSPLPISASWINHMLLAQSLLLVGLGAIAMIWPARIALKRRGLHTLLPYTWALPLYYLLISIAAWLAFFELFYAPYRWNKTDHGIAKTSRTGALKVS
jgi:glycosyltransferase XagB